MAEGIKFNTVINNIKKEAFAENKAASVFLPSEEYRSLYHLLDIYGSIQEDKDTQDKVKYIHETLKEQGNTKEILFGLISDLGICPFNESQLNRIWKFINLNKKAQQAKKYWDNINTEIEQLKGKR